MALAPLCVLFVIRSYWFRVKHFAIAASLWSSYTVFEVRSGSKRLCHLWRHVLWTTSLVHQAAMSPKLTLKEPSVGVVDIQVPSVRWNPDPSISSCARMVRNPQSVCVPRLEQACVYDWMFVRDGLLCKTNLSLSNRNYWFQSVVVTLVLELRVLSLRHRCGRAYSAFALTVIETIRKCRQLSSDWKRPFQ
jgi:hypothetical protein